MWLKCWILVCLLWIAGCTHVNHLRDAQDSFSRAAEAEHRALFSARDGSFASRTYATGGQDLGQISAGYAAALNSLDALEGDSQAVAKLKNDRLYGNALALRALAYWRLGRMDEARKSAAAALANGLDPGSRDFALMTALPALADNDSAHSEIHAAGGSKIALDSILKKLNAAEAQLCTADRSVAVDHPIRIYLALSALAALRNVVAACDKQHPSEPVKSLECFKGGEVKRDERAKAYHERLVREFKVDASTLLPFVLGVPMATAAGANPCPRP
jgi:tetratricopeptide (TPR) repeat protein